MMRVHRGNIAILEGEFHVEIAHRIIEHLAVFAPGFHCPQFILQKGFSILNLPW